MHHGFKSRYSPQVEMALTRQNSRHNEHRSFGANTLSQHFRDILPGAGGLAAEAMVRVFAGVSSAPLAGELLPAATA